MFCPRRFALLEINSDWAENAYVVKANLMHEKVHSGEHNFSSKNKIAMSSVTIYNDNPEYSLYGVTDCIELTPNKNGAEIHGQNGKFNVTIVEYKPTKPKNADYHESDAIQVFAQKICADFLWKCDSKAVLFYGDVHRRIPLPFEEKYKYYDNLIKGYLKEMRKIYENGQIPPKPKGQRCSGCSLSDICCPKSTKYNVKSAILEMEKEL